MSQSDDLNFAPDAPRALAFFKGQPGYAPSPLHRLEGPDGVALWAKDETGRMGLGAFKALGAPYALARVLQAGWQAESGESFDSYAARQMFVCASAGNHGLGVAAGAQKMGARARIHLAQTVPQSFAKRLEAFGAEVRRSGAVYDDAVAAASRDAEESGATLLADGTWPGYTAIPKWVMEGYCVIAEELRAVFEADGQWPTHVFVQAGVGGLAAAMAHMIRATWAEQPQITIVEPEAAPCLLASHRAGQPVRGEGPDSVMGRLDCKEPSIVAWQALERCDVQYELLSEAESTAAAEALSGLVAPTTPSGAAGYGALVKAVAAGALEPGARALVVVSEGAAG